MFGKLVHLDTNYVMLEGQGHMSEITVTGGKCCNNVSLSGGFVVAAAVIFSGRGVRVCSGELFLV